MEKFKVGDKVTVKGGGDKIHEVTYVYRDGSVQLDNSGTAVFRPMFLMLANSVCNAVIEKKLPPRGAGVYIEQQGALFAVGPTDDGWSVANYGGEGVNFAHGFKTSSEAKSWCASKGYKVEDIILSNSLRSRNAVVQKALNAQTSVLRETAVNANASRVFKPGEEVRWEYIDGDGDSGVVVADKGSYLEVRLRDGSIEKPSKMLITSNASRSTNAVVAKALNASHKHLS